jgi:acetylornithine deacetylase/succinyl-diaminopimelate desuccinylase-like protein
MDGQGKNEAHNLSRRRFVKASGAAVLAAGAVPVVSSAAVPGADALKLANARRSEMVDLLSEMIRIRSQSGESAEAAQGVVTDYLQRLPYTIEESADRPSDYRDHAEFMPPNPPGDGPFVNVVGHPDGGSKHALFSHIDTHLIEDGWETDPYEPVTRGNRLYGLGTSDDKGGVAAMLVAAAVLDDMGGPLPVVMSLHGKGGGSRGSLPVFERFKRSGADIDAVLYVHPAETGRGLDDIKNEVQGILDLELSVTGWRAPAMEINSIDSAPWAGGGNALDVCDAALDELRGSVFSATPFNLGSVNGGDRVGSVAEQANARFRIKFSGDDNWTGLLAAARARLVKFQEGLPAGGDGYSIELNTIGYRTNPGAADWEAPVSRVLRNSIEDVTGKAPSAYPNHYAGDIRYPIRLLGVPAYGIGSLGGGFYGPNEWVDIDDLVRLVAVIVQTLSGWSEI